MRFTYLLAIAVSSSACLTATRGPSFEAPAPLALHAGQITLQLHERRSYTLNWEQLQIGPRLRATRPRDIALGTRDEAMLAADLGDIPDGRGPDILIEVRPKQSRVDWVTTGIEGRHQVTVDVDVVVFDPEGYTVYAGAGRSWGARRGRADIPTLQDMMRRALADAVRQALLLERAQINASLQRYVDDARQAAAERRPAAAETASTSTLAAVIAANGRPTLVGTGTTAVVVAASNFMAPQGAFTASAPQGFTESGRGMVNAMALQAGAPPPPDEAQAEGGPPDVDYSAGQEGAPPPPDDIDAGASGDDPLADRPWDPQPWDSGDDGRIRLLLRGGGGLGMLSINDGDERNGLRLSFMGGLYLPMGEAAGVHALFGYGRSTIDDQTLTDYSVGGALALNLAEDPTETSFVVSFGGMYTFDGTLEFDGTNLGGISGFDGPNFFFDFAFVGDRTGLFALGASVTAGVSFLKAGDVELQQTYALFSVGFY